MVGKYIHLHGNLVSEIGKQMAHAVRVTHSPDSNIIVIGTCEKT